MDQLNQERRGMFGGLRVPFDLNMLVLAFFAVVGFFALITLTEVATGDAHVLRKVADRFIRPDLYRAAPLQPITWLLFGTIFLGYWSFFSSAISRIAAMKLAREETLELKEAASFASRKFVPVLSSVLFVATILDVFYVICNATIAGFLMRVPGLDILVSILFFTVLLSTFFIVFSLVLGVFGMNLAASAIATESSDTWDGISRAWNYILVRPWHVILVYGVTVAYLGIFGFFSTTFMHWSVNSLALGDWGAGEHAQVVERDRADLPIHLQEKVPADAKTADFLIPGRVEFFRGFIFADPYSDTKYTWDNVTYSLGDADKKFYDDLPKEKQQDIRNPPYANPVNVAAVVPTTWKISASIIWFWLWIARFAIAAYALQYFFAATTTLYFILRKEVEDEDYSEIVVEEEELEEEAAWEVKEPAKPGATAPAGGLVMPTSGVPGNSNLKPLPMMGNTTAPAGHTPNPAGTSENKS